MLDYGVQVLLGTDSLASVPNLNLLEEMQFALQQHPTVSPEVIYRLGTLDGAMALGLPKGFGTIQPGSPARFANIKAGDHPFFKYVCNRSKTSSKTNGLPR